MQIGNFIPSSETIDLLLGGVMWMTIIGAVIGAVSYWIRNKLKYKYYGEINKRRQIIEDTGMPTSKHIEGKAGYFNTKKKGRVFRIKYGLMPWHVIELKKKPLPEYMVDNKVYYNQYNEGQLIQAKAKIDWETDEFKIEPVDDNLSDEILYDIERREKVLNVNNVNKPMIVGMTVLGLIIVAGIIVFWFLSKA